MGVGPYLPRIADGEIAADLATFGAVVVQGPRAVGKTTTAQRWSASSVRLDSDPNLPALASTDPSLVLSGETPRLIDEWQLAPTLWNAVRHEVDARQRAGQFILTGSATPPDDVTRHSGAGRFSRVTLRPMALFESGDSTGTVAFGSLLTPAESPRVAGFGGPTVSDYSRLLVRGGWPSLVTRPETEPARFLRAYLDEVARVDLPEVNLSVDPTRMAALITALARNVSTEAQLSKLATEAQIGTSGLADKTVRRYLDALTRIFVVEEQPAWAPHLRSRVRLRQRPKWHFIDPSLAAAALRAGSSELLADLNTFGLLFESMAIRDLRVYSDSLDASVTHYRDETGLEVDAIVEQRGGVWSAFEIKMGGEPAIEGAARSLAALAKKVAPQRREQLATLNVLTAGTVSYTRPDGVNVIALGHLKP